MSYQLPAALHAKAKRLARLLEITVSDLVGQALEREIARRLEEDRGLAVLLARDPRDQPPTPRADSGRLGRSAIRKRHAIRKGAKLPPPHEPTSDEVAEAIRERDRPDRCPARTRAPDGYEARCLYPRTRPHRRHLSRSGHTW